MNYRLQMLFEYIVFIILFLIGSFQLLISLWHTTETYSFSSPITAIIIFIIMLSGLANIMNGFAFVKSKSKFNFILLVFISLIYVSLIVLYLKIVVNEEAVNANVTYTFGLMRSMTVMAISGISIVIANIIAIFQMKSVNYEKK